MKGPYNPNFIYAGKLLHVPCGGATFPPALGDGQPTSGICTNYLVRPGDYLDSIAAARFGTTWQVISQVNRMNNPNWNYPGMRLAIPCKTMPPLVRAPLTPTSAKQHDDLNFPADWTINVRTARPWRDPQSVDLRAPATSLPLAQIYALKDLPPLAGFENCNNNPIFRCIPACSISLPKGQILATKLIIFE